MCVCVCVIRSCTGKQVAASHSHVKLLYRQVTAHACAHAYTLAVSMHEYFSTFR